MEPIELLRRKGLLESLESYRGREALYREGQRFGRVRVEGFESTDKGLDVQLTLIPTPGLYSEWSPSWKVYSHWERIRDVQDVWISPYIGMKMYFEPGLVAAIVSWCESCPVADYDSARFDEVVDRIQRYRKQEWKRRTNGVLQLFLNESLLGAVTEHFLCEVSELHGKFSTADFDEELKLALAGYYDWSMNSWGRDDSPPAPIEKLRDNWWIKTENDLQIQVSIPKISFTRGTINFTLLSIR